MLDLKTQTGKRLPITMCLTCLTIVKELRTAAEMDEIVKTSVKVLHHSHHYGRDTKREKIFTRGQQNAQDVPTSPGRVIPTKKRWMGVPPGQKAKASRDKSGEVVLNVLNRSSGVVRCQVLLENGLFVAY